MRFKATRHRPIVAWRPRRADGSLGCPVALNPIESLALSGAMPDPVTLAERGFYRGLEGLGRFAAEAATEGVLAPTGADGVGDARQLGEVGELGFLPALAPFIVPILEAIGAGAVSALAAKGVDKLLEGVDDVHRRDAALRRELAGANLHNQAGVRPGHVEADLVSGLASSSLGGASDYRVGRLGIFGRLRRKKNETASSSANPGISRRVADGTRAGFNLLSIGKNLLSIRKKLKSGKRVTPSEVLKFFRNMVKQANQLLGGPGEPQVVAHLAGVGATLDALERIDRSCRTRAPLGWRPTLAEYGSACSRVAVQDPRLRELVRGVSFGALDSTRRESAALHAAQARGIQPGQQLPQPALGELGAAGDFLQALANGAVELLQDVQRMPVERAVIEGARTVLNDLVGATQQAQVQQIRVADTGQRLQEFRSGLDQLQQQRTAATSLPLQAGIDRELERVRELVSSAERVKAESERKLAELQDVIAEKRKAAAPIASMVKDASDSAQAAEQNRVQQVNELADRDLLRGHVMVLSRQEYADLIRRTNEAEAGRDKLQQLATQTDKERKSVAARLADAQVRIVQLKQQLADLQSRAVEQEKQREIAEAIESNRREMADQIRILQDGFRSQIQQVRDRTREAVAQAGDVVNQTGVQLMFQFVRDLTNSMREIRDVSHAGEFLRLFPEVLQQLRVAQEIASPETPNVNVTVPAQAAPVVNVAPPNVHVDPPQFVLGPGFELRPANQSGGGSSGGGAEPFVQVPPVPVAAV